MRISVVLPAYNERDAIRHCIDSLLAQSYECGTEVQIVIVDDGSTDGTGDFVKAAYGERVKVISLTHNLGRSNARNAGAIALPSDVLLFVDADCTTGDSLLIQAHLDAFRSGADVSFGDVRTPSSGFWARLQEDAAAQRRVLAAKGDHWLLTTANVAVRTEVFEAAGGFDPTFNRHGFEDRDLFLRLMQHGARATFTENAVVIHEGRVSLQRTCASLLGAGRYSAQTFSNRHRKAYRRLSFAKFDCMIHPSLRWMDYVTWPLGQGLAAIPSPWLEKRWIPFKIRLAVARAAYALHYLHGTALATKEPRPRAKA